MPDPSDESLILAAGRGDPDAFRQLVERRQPAIGSFILRFLATRDRNVAEDLTQDVFLAAWRAARSFRPDRPVLTWLFRIAANRCLNYRRDRRLREPPGEAAAPGGAAGPPEAGLGVEDSERVRAAVARLPANQRAAIVLRHFHAQSYAEIAEIMDVSISAVESLLFRARRELQVDLAGEGNEAGRQRKQESGPQVSPDSGVEHY